MNKGFIAMTTVLILSVAMVAIMTTVSLLSIGESQSGFALMKGEGALQFSEGCAEDALLRIRADEAYIGGTFSHPEGECTADIASDGSIKTITVRSNAVDYSRSISIMLERTVTGITLISWHEIP
ncbi:MAG: hypothetical protein PHT88_03420 [Candidatus Moranbacteria bacterium]|nr:hypothetical protein [Candidatus Moranbacteria bacterium]